MNQGFNSADLFKHILIQTNTKCTRKCSFCLYGMKDVTIDESEMPDWLFEKIVSELAAIRYSGRVSLFEINEPLLDAKIVERVAYVKEKVPDSWQYINSNGDLLTPGLATQLIEAGLDYLTINSYSIAAYRKTKAIRNSLPSKIRERVIHLDRFSYDFALDNRGGNLPHIEELSEPLNAGCSRVNNVLYVKPDGTVVSCFGDFFNKNVMGDAKVQHVVDIWFGETFSHLRDNLNNKNRTVSELCSKCNIPEEGNYLDSYNRLPALAGRTNVLAGAAVGASASFKMFYPYLAKYSKLLYLISSHATNESLGIKNIKITEKYDRVLTDPRIDYVFVANQNQFHFSVAMEALKAGKHVLIEKPLTLSLKDYHELKQVSEAQGLIIGGIFQWRFLNVVRVVKNALADGALGEVLFVNCKMFWKRDDAYFENGRGSVFYDGGGVLIKQAIHCLDLLIYLIGLPVSWNALGSNTTGKREVEDSVLVTLEFPKGFGVVEATVSAEENLPPEIEIVGSKGHVRFSFNDVITHWRCAYPAGEPKKKISVLDRQIENFINALQGKEPLVVTPEECVKSLGIILDIYDRHNLAKHEMIQ